MYHINEVNIKMQYINKTQYMNKSNTTPIKQTLRRNTLIFIKQLVIPE